MVVFTNKVVYQIEKSFNFITHILLYDTFQAHDVNYPQVWVFFMKI